MESNQCLWSAVFGRVWPGEKRHRVAGHTGNTWLLGCTHRFYQLAHLQETVVLWSTACITFRPTFTKLKRMGTESRRWSHCIAPNPNLVCKELKSLALTVKRILSQKIYLSPFLPYHFWFAPTIWEDAVQWISSFRVSVTQEWNPIWKSAQQWQ